MTDRYYDHKQRWRDHRTDATYRSPRRRAEAFEREFGCTIDRFDFSALDENDRTLFVAWLQGATMVQLGPPASVKRAIDRCFEVLRMREGK